MSSHRHTNLLMLACIFFSVLVVRRGNILSEPRILAKSASIWESLSMPAMEVPLLLPLGIFCGLVYRLYAQFRTGLLNWLHATMHIDESVGDGAYLRLRQLLRHWLLGAGVASIACAYAATHGFTQSLALGMEVVQQLLCPSITSSHLTSLRYLLSFVVSLPCRDAQCLVIDTDTVRVDAVHSLRFGCCVQRGEGSHRRTIRAAVFPRCRSRCSFPSPQ